MMMGVVHDSQGPIWPTELAKEMPVFMVYKCPVAPFTNMV